MLDKVLKAVLGRIETYAAAAAEQRLAIERERAGDKARQHAGREFDNAEGFTTPLRTAFRNAQNSYARARRAFRDAGGMEALTLGIAMMHAREQRDEAKEALKKYEADEQSRLGDGVHRDIKPFFASMFDHGVEPRHLANVRRETIAIICDLIRWDGQDPEMADASSPMPGVFGIYASRQILKSGQFGDRSRSVPGKPVIAVRYTDPRHYRFDLLVPASEPAQQDDAVPSSTPASVDTITAADAVQVQEAEALEVQAAPDESPAALDRLTPERAQEIAENIYLATPTMMRIFWQKGVEQDDYTPERLIPALEQWVASTDSWGGAADFLTAARAGRAREFIADARARGISNLAKRLLAGDERALTRARLAGVNMAG